MDPEIPPGMGGPGMPTVQAMMTTIIPGNDFNFVPGLPYPHPSSQDEEEDIPRQQYKEHMARMKQYKHKKENVGLRTLCSCESSTKSRLTNKTLQRQRSRWRTIVSTEKLQPLQSFSSNTRQVVETPTRVKTHRSHQEEKHERQRQHYDVRPRYSGRTSPVVGQDNTWTAVTRPESTSNIKRNDRKNINRNNFSTSSSHPASSNKTPTSSTSSSNSRTGNLKQGCFISRTSVYCLNGR